MIESESEIPAWLQLWCPWDTETRAGSVSVWAKVLDFCGSFTSVEDVINDINNKTISSHKAADPWAVLCFVSYSWGEIGYLSPSIHLKLTRLNYRSRSKHWMFVEGRDCPSVCGGGWLRGLLLISEEGCLGQFPWGLLDCQRTSRCCTLGVCL